MNIVIHPVGCIPVCVPQTQWQVRCIIWILLLSRKAKATNLDTQVTERLYICIYVYISITVNYGHLVRVLGIVPVATYSYGQ